MKQEVFIFLSDELKVDEVIGGNLFITPVNFAFPPGTCVPVEYVFTTISGQVDDETLFGRIAIVFHDEPVIVALKYGIPGKSFFKLLEIERINGAKIAAAKIERVSEVE